MLEKMHIFRLASTMARHAGQRQAVVAQNMANADTPKYRARDITPFEEMVAGDSHGHGQRATRAGHLNGNTKANTPEISFAASDVSSPNGNSVSIEDEMVKAVETKQQHDRALAIYKSSLGILRTSLGRR